MTTRKKEFSTGSMVLIGLFAALCYVALFFKIPIPSPVGKPFLHMGNMFVILAALLFSGTIGGLSGSIGMGLFDLMNGYASSVPKTVLLKFGIGVIVGGVSSKGNKDDAKSPIKWIAIASSLLIVIGIALFAVSATFGNEVAVSGIEKKLVINPVLYILSLILGVALGAICIVSKNLSVKLQYAILGAVAGIAFNLIGEFLFGVVTLLLAGSSFIPAVLSSAVSLPATLINGSFSIFVAVALYIPLSKSVLKSKFNLS
ncbi:ECF transporter S component [Clostridium amazonitimonense]|uniref:ECF transporter S component n=1 Tax=Clostridium amazonitimonense TaxID=1499689 RepID=UPI00068A89AE|nr:ECF transporter S component [Clostridium amazonitimonense]